jgi:hypothetical protein
MDIFTHISQFWAALIQILWNITDTLVNTTNTIDSIEFEDNIFTQYMGYAKTVTGAPLWTMLTSVMMISIGVTVYKTFLKGVALVKDLLVRI